MKINEKYEVTWLDHYNHNHGWVDSLDEIPLNIECTTVGYFVGERDDHLIFADTIADGKYRNIWMLVKLAIINIRKLRF